MHESRQPWNFKNRILKKGELAAPINIKTLWLLMYSNLNNNYVYWSLYQLLFSISSYPRPHLVYVFNKVILARTHPTRATLAPLNVPSNWLYLSACFLISLHTTQQLINCQRKRTVSYAPLPAPAEMKAAAWDSFWKCPRRSPSGSLVSVSISGVGIESASTATRFTMG